ncbi:AAT family amino acid transporter [Microbotryum lychnidis-dioicae p1A1 Lamole]|uniref:AAT family amino acid transporter n=1 Tax=Microbotryum lychnidis-dioicae (strain p1A1 Lamole / MvSl-1064) TaxID=683840 RepID=U5H7N2_USTV1|nr:AAT family amino acid transporter [Microbotryum lychnidis-dioicae p1A1 Lamole]|eukprot:KDE06473.1 AAT family amino acid transporter [Microbotryum lychnidis-dioicae p1A1 Lamole]
MSNQFKDHTDYEKGESIDGPTATAYPPGGQPLDQMTGDNAPLQRQLKSRHIQMISISGVVGTGLFMGTANALRHGGPLGLLMGFAAMGSITFGVMVSLGEMIAALPIPGGHISLAQRFVNPAFSFAMGWNYWYNWTIVLPAELNAAAVLIGYWNNKVNPGVWIAVCLVVAAAINVGGTKMYGECEFWFAIIKVLTIVGLIILGIILDAGGVTGDPIGFRYWRNPGVFVQYLGLEGAKGRFLGFWAVLIQAAFSYIGTEIVAITAGEAKNPKKTLPKAIRRIYVRILLFYILGVFVIGLLVASDDPRLNLKVGTAARSPFVIAINNAGIPALPSIINACLLTSAWSAASSDLYVSSRALYGLALNGNAPKFLRKTNRWGLPYICVIVGILFSFLAFMSVGSSSAGEVFGWFANMTSVCGLSTWTGICFTYIRFSKAMKAQGLSRDTLVYKAPLQPFLAYYALIFSLIVLFFNGWEVFVHVDGHFDKATFITSYFPILFFPVLYFGYRFTKGGPLVPYGESDLISGSRPEEEEEVEKKPKNFIMKVWAFIM